MRLGRTVNSSWGNGNPTLCKGMIRALMTMGCRYVSRARQALVLRHARSVDVAQARAVAVRRFSMFVARPLREIRRRRRSPDHLFVIASDVATPGNGHEAVLPFSNRP